MLLSYAHSGTSLILRVKLRNSSVSTGAGLSGLSSASSGLIISTIADNEATATVYSVAAETIEGITTLGTYQTPTATKCRFKEVDATNHPGIYEIHLADARFAVSGAKSLLVSISGASNLAECDALVPLWQLSPYVAVPSVDVAKWKNVVPADLADTNKVPVSVQHMANDVITANATADNLLAELALAIEQAIVDDTTGEQVKQAIIDKLLENLPDIDDLTLAAIALQVRTELATELARIDAPITSRMASYTQPTGFLAATFPTSGTIAKQGDAMDLVDTPNQTAIAALQSGITPAELLDLADGVETDVTLRQAARLVLAVLLGKLSGADGSTITMRDVNDTKDRVVATVDEHGNRSSLTLDPD